MIEKSVIKNYRKELWSNFITAVNEFNLIENNDKIAVCYSGGKDSFLLSILLEELKKHGKIKFELKFIMLDPGFSEEKIIEIKENASKINIDLIIYKENIFEKLKNYDKPCFACAKMRRGSLYAKAKALGCNKIALGHHFNDVIETILMSMIYNGKFKTMLPNIKSTNFENMNLIRPLYYVKEKDIIKFTEYNNLKFSKNSCNLYDEYSGKSREKVKELIQELNKLYSKADKNILSATKNVNLENLINNKK